MYETRIFFLLDGLDDNTRSRLSLANKTFSAALFPDEGENPPIIHGSLEFAEKRIDDYFLLTGCPLAHEIGLKSRGGSKKTKLELKTTLTSENNNPESMEYWIKSREKGRMDPMDPNVVLDFLHRCNPRQEEKVNAVVSWIQNWISDQQQALPTVRASKSRRTTSIQNGAIQIEETDVAFQFNRQTICMRSISAESLLDNLNMQSIAKNWKTRFATAATVANTNPPPPSWVASYPAIILQIPQLLAKSC